MEKIIGKRHFMYITPQREQYTLYINRGTTEQVIDLKKEQLQLLKLLIEEVLSE